MIEHSEELNEIAKALHKAQGAIGGAVRDERNPHFKSSYATLESVVAVAKPALQAAGLALTQAPGRMIDGELPITTMLIHGASGQWMRTTLYIPVSKRDPQGVGSAITYGCRYSLMSFLVIPPIDDDAESAMQRNEPAPPKASSADSHPSVIKARADVEAELNRSAQKGSKVLRAAWDSISPAMREHFAAAKDRRFKPMAEAADRGLATEGEAA